MSKPRQSDAALLVSCQQLATIAQKLPRIPKAYGGDELAVRVKTFGALVSSAGSARVAYRRAAAEKQRAAADLRALVTQLKAAVRGIYGVDSPEYAAVGGRRTSDRKRPSKKPAAAPKTPASVAPPTDTVH